MTAELTPAPTQIPAPGIVDDVKQAVTDLGNTAVKLVQHRQLADQATASVAELADELGHQLDALRNALIPHDSRNNSRRRSPGQVSGAISQWLVANPAGGRVSDIAEETGLTNQQVSGSHHTLKIRGEVRNTGGTWTHTKFDGVEW